MFRRSLYGADPDNSVKVGDDRIPMLFSAVSNGDHLKCSDILTSGVNVAQYPECGVLVTRAASKPHWDIVMLLLDHGLEINTRSATGQAAIHYALQHEDTSRLQQLVDRGADVNVKKMAFKYAGDTCLHIASHKNLLEAARILIDAGCAIDTNSVETPLHIAVGKGHEEMARLLLEAGADANLQNLALRLTPLHIAVSRPNIQIVKMLIPRTKPSLKSFKKENALFFAAQFGNVEAVRLLAEAGWDVNTPNMQGMTALLKAVESANTPLVEVLMNAGCDINQMHRVYNMHTEQWECALHRLCSSLGLRGVHSKQKCQDLVDTLELLLSRPDCQVNTRTEPGGETPLHVAVRSHSIEAASLLLRHGADVQAEREGHKTCIIGAIHTRNLDMMQLMAGAGLRLTPLQLYHEGPEGYLNMLTATFDSEFVEWFGMACLRPPTLRDQCRLAIRRQIHAPPFCDNVQILPLPEELKSYILIC